MDPHSRRAIWALLREVRRGRTVVLTTHFLDEAELLADRIAIMADGCLRCAGSPLFLKEHFGVGVRLTASKTPPAAEPACSAEAVLELARSHLADAALLSDSPLELEVLLPGKALGAAARLRALQALLAALEPRLSALGLSGFGVGCTRLEDVFLQINADAIARLEGLEGRRQRRQHVLARAAAGPGGSGGGGSGGGGAAGGGAFARPAVGGSGGVQLSSLGGGSGAASPPPSPEEAGSHLRLGGCRSSESHPAPLLPAPLRPPDGGRGGCLPSCSAAYGQYVGLLAKRRLTAQRSPCTSGCMLLFPVALVLLALLLLSAAIHSDQPRLRLDQPRDIFSDGVGPGALAADTPATSALVEGWEKQGWSVGGEKPACDVGFPAAAQNLSAYLAQHPDTRRPVAVAASDAAVLWSSGLRRRQVVTLAFNATSTHALPALVHALYARLYANRTGGAGHISASVQPLPDTDSTQHALSAFASLFIAIMIMIPFAFVGAAFVSPLVAERESGAKQLQRVAGASGTVYWLASWSWDLLTYLLVVGCTLAAFLAVKREEFTGSREATLATTTVLLLFGWAALPLASCASFLFRSPSRALIGMTTFHLLSGFGLLVGDFILASVAGAASGTNARLRPLYNLFPAYALGKALLDLATRDLLSTFGVAARSSLFDWETLGRPMALLFGEGVAFAALALLLEALGEALPWLAGCRPSLPGRLAAGGVSAVEDEDEDEDETVRRERRLVEGGASAADPATAERLASRGVHCARDPPEEEAPLAVRRLRKVYGNLCGGGKVAVADLCLRVERGECFGFLGTNGAGKSTTFAMLTGATAPTSGDALLHGLSSRHEQPQIRRQLGYCPQHDALLALLTARETLRLYARIKRVPPAAIEATVESLLLDLDLARFGDKPAGQLSGGNKRKLCVGIALVGAPSLVLLDEPSSGMDAASKRFLWAAIKRRTADACTVLTSHSMEECEALCGRIGVMVGGKLRCIGPIQALKSRFGSSCGLKLELRLHSEQAQQQAALLDRLWHTCGARLDEAEPPRLTLTVPQRGEPLSLLFGHLAEACEAFAVSECSVTQCSLEQIFLLLASGTSPPPAASPPLAAAGKT